jgi:hypothetical protein
LCYNFWNFSRDKRTENYVADTRGFSFFFSTADTEFHLGTPAGQKPESEFRPVGGATTSEIGPSIYLIYLKKTELNCIALHENIYYVQLTFTNCIFNLKLKVQSYSNINIKYKSNIKCILEGSQNNYTDTLFCIATMEFRDSYSTVGTEFDLCCSILRTEFKNFQQRRMEFGYCS